MDKDIGDLLKPLYGKKCCRVRVGASKSLSIGFGKRVFHNDPKLDDDYYGEWELGTYYCCWRILKDGKIICGVNDPVENINDLNENMNNIEFGSIVSIENISELDVRVTLDSGVTVEFLSAISDEDEYFHVFCPGNKYIQFSSGGKWHILESNMPYRPD